VDPFTGYRYYSEEQLKPAKLILVLRRLDMPRQVLQWRSVCR
jgi:DNA-binding transcriptional MerR regulator